MKKHKPYTQALITGASSGIGESLARAFGKSGLSLVLIARSKMALDKIADDIRTSNVTVNTLPLDLIQPDALDKLIQYLKEKNIEIDLLVNNAGFGSYGYFHGLNAARELEMIQLNISALVKFTHHFIQPMIRRNHGAVINISSTAGFQPVPFMATYGATKAFVTSFTMALHSEYKDTGVSFIAVCPGRTKTQFQVVSGSEQITIKSRFATTDQVTRVTMKALSNHSSFIIEGWPNKIAVHLQRFFPREWVLYLARRIFKPHSV